LHWNSDKTSKIASALQIFGFGHALTPANVFAILKSSARYPSGPRERSAKPPVVGSNPTRASNFLFSNQWITTFVSFPPSPTWEHLGTTGKRASCPNSCPIPQQLPLRAMWIASHSSPSDSLSELQFTAGLARQIQFREDVRIEEAPRSGCSCKGVLLDFTTAESRRKSLSPPGQFPPPFRSVGQS